MKNEIIKKIDKLNFPENEVVLTLEEFFIDNPNEGSIGPNIYPTLIPLEEFYRKLKSIRKLDEVQDVLIRVYEIEFDWPYTENVYIITKQETNKISNYVNDLCPSEIAEGWSNKKPINAPDIFPGMKIINLWWD